MLDNTDVHSDGRSRPPETARPFGAVDPATEAVRVCIDDVLGLGSICGYEARS